MRTLNLRINFFWDDGDDMETFELTVPSNVSNAEILDVLKKYQVLYLDILLEKPRSLLRKNIYDVKNKH